MNDASTFWGAALIITILELSVCSENPRFSAVYSLLNNSHSEKIPIKNSKIYKKTKISKNIISSKKFERDNI